MFLNDYCDVAFDRKYKRDRPIVAGEVTRRAVGLAALGCFGAGLLLALAIGPQVLLFAILLTGVIAVYDFSHKRIAWAPVLMAACRFLLYLMAAAAGIVGIGSSALGFALGLAIYVVGLSYLARGESRPGKASGWWPLLLFAPVLAGICFHSTRLALLAGLPLLAWIVWSLFLAKTNAGRGVAALLAGIVLVDLLAVAPVSLPFWLGFAALFAAALLFQRYVPAT
jgi:4-hydroxybenzoate polyprenyltransferase